MKVTQSSPSFRPVTIELETQDEFDKLMAILATVAQNKFNHQPQTICAAVEMCSALDRLDQS